jgi:acyl-CoA dehydrogenase
VQFELTDTQQEIQKWARKFAEKEFLPDLALELDREGKFPETVFEKACRLGFIGIHYPEEYGGQSLGLFEHTLTTDEFCKKDSGIGTAISLIDMASGIILRHGNEQQKKNRIPPVAQGKAVIAVAAMDAFEGGRFLPTKAEEGSSGYVLTGKKRFVLNGSLAHAFVVFCEDQQAVAPKSAKVVTLIVQRDQPGVSVWERRRMMGLRMIPVNDVSFDHVEVRRDCLIEGEGDHRSAFWGEQRIKAAAQGAGIAQRALTLAVAHAKEREQFGRKISQFQGLQFMFADLYTQIEAGRGLVHRAASAYDAKSRDWERIASVARLFATDVAVKAAIDSIQIHGGIGLMKDYLVERLFRDAKTIQNLGETNLIQKAFIGEKITL